MAKKVKTIDIEEYTNSFDKELESFLKSDKKIDVRVSNLSDKEYVTHFFNSGNYALNWVLSGDLLKGGFPNARVLDIAGDPGTGKSLIFQKIAGEIIRNGGSAWVIDTEDSWGIDFVGKVVGSKDVASKIKVIDNIKTLEKLESALFKIVDFKAKKKDDTPMAIFVDSISQLTSEAEIEIAATESGKVDMKKAQLIKRMFRVLDSMLRDANVAIFTAQHLISNIGVMFGPTKTTSGGTGVPYAADQRLQLLMAKLIEDENSKHPLGVRLNIKTTKNRIVVKDRQCYVDLMYKNGIDKHSGLLELLANYGVVSLSTKELAKSTTVKWGDIEFKAKKFKEWLEEQGEEDTINKFNDQLNGVIEAIENQEDLVYDSTGTDDE